MHPKGQGATYIRPGSYIGDSTVINYLQMSYFFLAKLQNMHVPYQSAVNSLGPEQTGSLMAELFKIIFLMENIDILIV